MAREINKAGLDLVKEFEGFYAAAYLCPAGVPTIGYGHTAGVALGQRISLEDAERLLREDLEKSGAAVERLVKVPLNDNQYAALTSFTFNLGEGSLAESTLLKRLNGGDYDAVPSEMARWVKAVDPKTKQSCALQGLVKRRAAEGHLWLTTEDADAFVSTGGMPQRVEQA